MYPISDEKRVALRLKGVVPFSRDFIAAGSILGLAITLLLVGRSLFAKLRAALIVGTAPTPEATVSVQALIKQSFSLYSELTISLIGGVLFFVLVFGLFQSKFLFNFNLIFGGRDKRRPLSGNNCDSSRRVRNITLGGLKYVVLCLMILIFSNAIFDTIQMKIFTKLQTVAVDQTAAIEVYTAELVSSFYWIFFLTVSFMAFVAICSLVLSRMQFAHDHQMSREEVMSQAREASSARVIEYES